MICNNLSRTNRSFFHTIVAAALVIFILGFGVLSASAAPQASGWSSFETGTWEPEIDWSKPKKTKKPDVEVRAATSYMGWIAEGKSHQTPYYVFDSGVEGPTVAVIGGMHGNEIAGWKSAWSVKDYWVKKGRLLVIPEANRPAVNEEERKSSLGDLNRDFPRTSKDKPDNYLAQSIWNLMVEFKPDWLIDMHEGYSFHKINKNSVGQTVIYYPNGNAKSMAEKMVKAMNKHIDKKDHAFSTLKSPVKGSLARAVSIRLGTKGMIVETANKQPISVRTTQHLAALDAMLQELGMR
jgi:succinylglutamate desuccinylase